MPVMRKPKVARKMVRLLKRPNQIIAGMVTTATTPAQMVISKPMRDSETSKSRAMGLINPTANISKVTYTKAAKLMAVKGTIGNRDSRDSVAALDMRKLLPFHEGVKGIRQGCKSP